MSRRVFLTLPMDLQQHLDTLEPGQALCLHGETRDYAVIELQALEGLLSAAGMRSKPVPL